MRAAGPHAGRGVSSHQIARVRRLCLALPDTSERLKTATPCTAVAMAVVVPAPRAGS